MNKPIYHASFHTTFGGFGHDAHAIGEVDYSEDKAGLLVTIKIRLPRDSKETRISYIDIGKIPTMPSVYVLGPMSSMLERSKK